jgi:transcriptional regulator with XRE-family HTH domain
LAILIPALPFCHAELRAPKPKSDHYPTEISTLGDHIRKHRLDLDLMQRQVGEQIGVDEATITNWERNATDPAVRFIPAIIEFLDYDPLPPAISDIGGLNLLWNIPGVFVPLALKEIIGQARTQIFKDICPLLDKTLGCSCCRMTLLIL